MQTSELAGPSEIVYSPPVGFRKAIPAMVKLRAVLLQDGRCPECGELLGPYEGLQFDHVPALGLRGWDVQAQDSIPPSNDVEAIKAKHKDCHDAKTFGRRGTSKLSRQGGDVTAIAKLRRVTRKTEEFRQKILQKGSTTDEGTDAGQPTRVKPKTRWPKRKFNIRGGHHAPQSDDREEDGRETRR